MDNAIIIILYTFVFVRGSKWTGTKTKVFYLGRQLVIPEFSKNLNFLLTYNLSRYIILNIVTYKISRK